jgi:DNA-binding NtrC family response regulator
VSGTIMLGESMIDTLVTGLIAQQDLAPIQESLADSGVLLTPAGDVEEAAGKSASVVLIDADCYPWRDAVTQIRNLKPWVRVILVTRYVDARMWVEALNGGAYDLVSKPFHPRELRSVVLGALDVRAKMPSRTPVNMALSS